MPLLSRTTYRQVVKKLDHYKEQHEEDRRENPNSIPPAWGISLHMMIESTVRQNHEQCYKGLADQVLEYLTKQGLLVRYAGDYTFPTEEILPTEQEIRQTVQGYLEEKGD